MGVELSSFVGIALMDLYCKCGSKMGMELSSFVGTALMDLYCKCGSIDDSISVFNSMTIEDRNIQTWKLMLHGLGLEAVKLFREMEVSGVRPNEITFVWLLCGCAHSGLVNEGRFYFDVMRRKYSIEPNVKHYGCMEDLLGRAGMLAEAFESYAGRTESYSMGFSAECM